MDNRKIEHKRNPRLKANIFSKLFFCWSFPYLFYGSRHNLESKDIFELTSENYSELLGDKLERCWKTEMEEARKKNRRPCFWKVIAKTFGCRYLKCLFFLLTANLASMILPLILKLLISHFDENSTITTLEAYIYALLYMALVTIEKLLTSHAKYIMVKIGAQAKTSCSALVYRKLLKLPINSQSRSNGGKIITLLSNDIPRLQETFSFIHVIPITPIIFTMNIIFMYRYFGTNTVFVALIIILLNVPLRVFSASIITKLREKAAEKTDRRLLLIDEIFNGIRVIKMFTWEKPMEQLILLVRRMELDLIAKKMYFIIGLRAVFKTAQCITLYLTLAIFLLCGDKVTSTIIFPLIHYNFFFHVHSGYQLSICLAKLADAKAATNRVEEFLLAEEVTSISKLSDHSNVNVVSIVKNVTVSWTENENQAILKDINISLARKQLYALVGEIGSGKSSLLKVILGEMKPMSGQILNYGDISYASQEPWLFNGSIRNNILLGEPFNEERYNEVVSSCALDKDFEQLPYGDKTLVGERGTSLSSGQSSRVNLARAVYRNADVYLLDDPLASIDHCVSKCIFDKCINGLLKDKTRILVTQKLQYIKEADDIILIHNGQIQYQGDYENFRKINFFQYLSKNRELDMSTENPKHVSQDSISSFVKVDSEGNEINESNETEELLKSHKNNTKLKPNKDPEENVEPIREGNVPLSILKEFYCNKTLVAFSIILTLITHISNGGFDYLIAMWAQNQDKYYASLNSTDPDNSSKNFVDFQMILFYLLGSVVIGMGISFVLELLLFIRLHRKSCEKLLRNMISRLLGATVQFFDSNDSGRILNRFSRDLLIVDEYIPTMIMEVVKVPISAVIMIIQILVVSPYMAAPIIFELLLAFKLIAFFSKSIRSIKRLEARAKSLVLSHVNATFNGLVTIRSSKAGSMVQRSFNVEQDNYMAAGFTNIDIFATFFMWNELFLVNFSVLISFFLIPLKSTGVTSAIVGYVLTQIIMLSRFTYMAARYITVFDSFMISMERTFEYTELEQENNVTEKNCISKFANDWPNKGTIKFDHLNLIYSNSVNPALKNINIFIESGTKVGIIGRTGAGKTSLSTALFRLAESEGSLFIDDVDIKTVPLKNLRNKISILPQKSILFSTSLRNNLDPSEMFDDDTIWSALKCVKIGDVFQSLDEELDQGCLSSGQRQLLCLARTILKNNQILILDEATASLDTRTDDLIQDVVNENFKDCTILTIAHKLNSVVDSDKILVLDDGQVIEYDKPQVLLCQKDSYFYKMWQALYHKS